MAHQNSKMNDVWDHGALGHQRDANMWLDVSVVLASCVSSQARTRRWCIWCVMYVAGDDVKLCSDHFAGA